ncbi:tail protein X [Pseudomonas sp. JR33AA]|uniref:tail protein X n=1 Tax=Pseudomonas sp. JR33AA TaxID=2899113 RepID=UPI001F30FEB9|nr:tail protein X [Pseudomonas sp. JR33AA]MCE5978530.1 tail protein X [Pseudomonas sp. JR33AA]
MATTCRTSDGDLLDVICQRHYGNLNGTVEAVLDANPDLAREAQPYRAGLLVFLPDLSAPAVELLQLFD